PPRAPVAGPRELSDLYRLAGGGCRLLGGGLGRRPRQAEREHGGPGRGIGQRQADAGLLFALRHERQPQAAALAAARAASTEEPVEDVRLVLAGDAGTVIADDD